MATQNGQEQQMELHSRIKELNPTILLMCLVHLTGKWEYLDEFGPAMRPAPEAGKSEPEAIERIRTAVLEALIQDGQPKMSSLDDTQFRKMVGVCIGEPVDEAMVPLLRDQVRFPGEQRPSRVEPNDFSVLVIGAGMTGIAAGVELNAAGFDYRILEARDEVGGTWAINRYPGAAVDTPSHRYSLSFALNPSWSKFYPEGEEYLAYLKDVSERFGVVEHVDFNTRVLSLEWNEAAQEWVVHAEQNGTPVTYHANAVITALGFLTSPVKPSFAGQSDFEGLIVHSAEWDETLDLSGKNVVLVGTGCTAAQVAAAISPIVKDLTIIQRQANWVLPPGKVGLSVPEVERWGQENVPFYMQWSRVSEQRAIGGTEKALRVDRVWQATHDTISEENGRFIQVCIDYMNQKFDDRPDLFKLLKPTYPFFAKRPILDCGFYDAVKRSNVHIHEGTIDHYLSDSVILSDGAVIPCDVVVMATGFSLEFLRNIDVIGRDKQTIQELFGDEPRAYKGISVAGMPNLFMTCGPNSGPVGGGIGHSTSIEQQLRYIVTCLRVMVEEGITAIDVAKEAMREYNDALDADLAETVFQVVQDAHGYYRGVTGRPLFQFPRPPTVAREMWIGPDLSDYHVNRRDGSTMISPASMTQTIA